MHTKVRPLRQDPRWPNAHERLKELFRERLPEGMTQEEFGERYGIGSQGMVWQYLNGWTPLNIEAAEKFAAGLNCTIADISQEMASYIKERIVVRLGKISRRVAVFVAALSLAPFPSHDARSATLLSAFSANVCVLCQLLLALLLKAVGRALAVSFAICANACTTSALLKPSGKLSRPQSASPPSFLGAPGFSLPSSSPSWPRNIRTSSPPFATQ